MPRPLSNALRKRIVRAVESGLSCSAAAKKYGVSISAAVKLVQQWGGTGHYEAKPMGGYRGHKLTNHAALVERLVKDRADITLREMTERLGAIRIKVGKSSLARFLNYLGYSYKKHGLRQRARPRGRQGSSAL